jgi:hypothetical protein
LVSMLLRPFLNMSALFLTNMVSDSGANVGPCWNSQLLQRISTNIQESATNKINIITREGEKEIEKKTGEDNRPPTVRRQTCMGVVCCARNWRHCCTPTLACSQLYFLEWHRALVGMTVWPSGLRRWLQAPVRKGVGSNPTAVNV